MTLCCRSLHRKLVLLGLGLPLVMAFGLGCSGEGGPEVPAGLVLTPNQPTIPQGQSLKLKVTAVSSEGRALEGRVVTFSSSDESLVTVGSDGTMHSVGPLGNATVFAQTDGIGDSVHVSIAQRVVALEVSPESLTLNTTLNGILSATLRDFAGDSIATPGLVHYSSNDPLLIQVNQQGRVVAGGEAGQSSVTVTFDTLQVDVPVTVVRTPETILVDPLAVVLEPSAALQLGVTVLDLAGNQIPNPSISFVSNDPNLFSVSNTGLVTAFGASGAGTLTMTAGPAFKVVRVVIGAGVPSNLVHRTSTSTPMYQAAITSGGQLLVTGGNNATWSGQLPGFALSGMFRTVSRESRIAVNHAGNRAYVSGENQLLTLDLATHTELPPMMIPGSGVLSAIAISPDDQWAFVGGTRRIYSVNLATAQTDSFPASVGGASFLAMAPSGARLYAASDSVREIDLASGSVVRTFPGTVGPKGLAASADGLELFVADSARGELLVFELNSGGLSQRLLPHTRAYGVAASAHLIVVTWATVVSIYDAVTKQRLTELNLGIIPALPAISPDEKTVVVPNLAGRVDFIQ